MSTCAEGTNIFSTGAGKVVAVDGVATPIAFSVDGDLSTFRNLKAIATSVGIQGQSGFQFMHALREFIYVYVFTERVGEIVVNGLAFPEVCDDLGYADVLGDEITGLEHVLTWYESNRITSRSEPINIAFGNQVAYDAFLVGIKADITNAETGIAQFSLRFNFIPNISDDDDFCFESSETCVTVPCGPQSIGTKVSVVPRTDAAENGPQGSVTIKRTGDLSVDLTIPYTVTGTSTSGMDYTALSGTAVIPAGRTFVVLPVNIIDDSDVEGTETLTVQLGPSGDYDLSTADIATIAVRDDDTA